MSNNFRNINLRKKIFDYDTIVIGNKINSLIYAFMNDLPIIFYEIIPPFFNDNYSSDICNKIEFPEFKDEGEKKREIFDHLYFILSLSGKILINEPIDKIMVNDSLLTVNINNKSVKYKFNSLIFFDYNSGNINNNISFDNEIFELSSKIFECIKVKIRYEIIDYFLSKRIIYHDTIKNNSIDNFIKELHFFKNLIFSKFFLEQSDNLEDYSEISSKIMTKRLLKKSNMIPRYDIEHLRREKLEHIIVDKKKYQFSNFIFDYRNEFDILEEENIKESYVRRLNEIISRTCDRNYFISSDEKNFFE